MYINLGVFAVWILWRDVGNTAASGHQSVKKGGVKPATHISVDSSSGESPGDDVLGQSVEGSKVVGASLVVGSLIVVPLSVALIVTICARLYKRGSVRTVVDLLRIFVALLTTGATE